MAEWLGIGLQNRAQQFDSAWYLEGASPSEAPFSVIKGGLKESAGRAVFLQPPREAGGPERTTSIETSCASMRSLDRRQPGPCADAFRGGARSAACHEGRGGASVPGLRTGVVEKSHLRCSRKILGEMNLHRTMPVGTCLWHVSGGLLRINALRQTCQRHKARKHVRWQALQGRRAKGTSLHDNPLRSPLSAFEPLSTLRSPLSTETAAFAAKGLREWEIIANFAWSTKGRPINTCSLQRTILCRRVKIPS